MNIYLSSAYLAPISYYSKFLKASKVFIEQNDNYVKQTYRNRCSIIGANGLMPLSIPVEHNSGAKVLTKDIRIASHGNWQHMHWNAIVSAYNSTPFFEYYQDDFSPFYHTKFDYLFDFNQQLQNVILDLLSIDILPRKTEIYKEEIEDSDLDMRDVIHPKKDWAEHDPYFVSNPYYQVFSHKFGFIANASIIDLLFNMGNEAQLILSQSLK